MRKVHLEVVTREACAEAYKDSAFRFRYRVYSAQVQKKAVKMLVREIVAAQLITQTPKHLWAL